jgi:hypothetical protein
MHALKETCEQTHLATTLSNLQAPHLLSKKKCEQTYLATTLSNIQVTHPLSKKTCEQTHLATTLSKLQGPYLLGHHCLAHQTDSSQTHLKNTDQSLGSSQNDRPSSGWEESSPSLVNQ